MPKVHVPVISLSLLFITHFYVQSSLRELKNAVDLSRVINSFVLIIYYDNTVGGEKRIILL